MIGMEKEYIIVLVKVGRRSFRISGGLCVLRVVCLVGIELSLLSLRSFVFVLLYIVLLVFEYDKVRMKEWYICCI